MDLGQELCKVLHLDPSKTKNIVISCKMDSVVMVHVTQYLQDYEVKPVLDILNKYKLEPKPDDGTNEKPTEDTGDTLINFMQ